MTVWHPPRSVLELVELAAIGAIDRVPTSALADAPPLHPAEGHEPLAEWTIEDDEGTPVAALEPDGVVRALRPFAHGPLRGRRLSPQTLIDRDGPSHRHAVIINGPVTAAATARLRARRAQQNPDGAPTTFVWLPLIGAGRTGYPATLPGIDEYARWRATNALARAFDDDPVVIPVALPAGHDELLPEIAAAYGAPELTQLPTRVDRSAEEVLHPAWLVESRRVHTEPNERGLVVFFTGLSGSGKSTVAKAVTERILESGSRRVTLLDGDEVRRMLSAGLGFSAADREANIRRIGFVAAEVARHGGVAICAPIAPFEATRAEVRSMVEAAGGDLVLVHVATPLAECERRDRKGLYAKARAGEIPNFTGISAPYEEPKHADVRVDTSELSLTEAVDVVWAWLKRGRYLTEG